MLPSSPARSDMDASGFGSSVRASTRQLRYRPLTGNYAVVVMTLALAAEAGIAAGGFARIPGLARITKIATME